MPSGYGDLIAWANSHTPNVEVKNLQSSWKDGFAFLDLFNSFVSGYVDLSKAERDLPPPGHCQRAFDLFEHKLGVPQMLTVAVVSARFVELSACYRCSK